MAFELPAGLVAREYGQVTGDDGVAGIEDQQPSGTRMLVALGFPSRWPGFGVTADAADMAVRATDSLLGLRTWPELDRYIIPDDTEAVWWVAYRSSPAWWLLLAGVLLAIIAVAVTFRVVWTVMPEEARSGLESLGNLIPLLLMAVMMSILPNLLQGIIPQVGRGLPGGRDT